VIEVRFDASSIARVRFAGSPVYEAVSWLAITRAGQAHPLLGDPGAAARFALRDRCVATAAAMVLPWAGGHYMPDFLTPKPPPASDGWALASQLDHISSTSPECLDMQLRYMQHHTPLAAELRRTADSGRLASVVAAGLQRFWTEVVAEMWPSLQRSIRQDVVRQTSLMAVGGTGTVLNGLHRTLRWSDGTMHIDKPYREKIDFRDGELVLVPSVLGPQRLAAQVWDPDDAALAYPIAPSDEPFSDMASDTALLGAGRAAVLRALRSPSSTTELRGMLGLSASTISHHLQVLANAGLATSTRQGRFVMYQQTASGSALLDSLRESRSARYRRSGGRHRSQLAAPDDEPWR
jgi:DNA-binding transcriptional ArsR family regulator